MVDEVDLTRGAKRGGRKAVKDAEGSSKLGRKVVVLDDDEDSDASVVSVSRSIAPTGDVRAAVEKFGSVESDDEVQLQARKTRPAIQARSAFKGNAGGKANRFSPCFFRVFVAIDVWCGARRDVVPSSDVEEQAEVSDTGLSVASDEPYLVVDKRRRSGGDDNDSPSKIRVKDLTLSPRKMPASAVVATGRGEGPVGDTTPRRTSGRVRKPTARAMHAGDEEVTSADQLDAIGSDAGDSSPVKSSEGSLYTPPSTRVRNAGRTRKGKVVPLASLQTGKVVAPQDAAMVSPTVTDYDPLALSESDDELPSPTTAMARRSDGKRKRKTAGSARANHPSSAPGQVAADSRLPVSQSATGSVGCSEQLNVHVTQKETGATSVFSGAMALPEEDDESVGSEEDESGNQEGDVVVEPLLDVDRIHPDLVELYRSMSWIDSLKRSKFVGYPTAITENAFDDFKPASYGGLVETVNNRVRSKLVRSVSFIAYRDFKSPVRVPLTGYVRTWECVRVPRPEGARNAAFVLSGVCLQSYVSQGREVGPSFVKQLHIRPLENDWDILQCNFGTFFNDGELHAPGRRNTLVFQTKREGWTPKQFEDDKFASTPYSSPTKKAAGSSASRPVEDASLGGVDVAKVNILQKGAPAYRQFDEGIPLYDGRTKVGSKGFKFEPADWEHYTDLPLYPFAEVEANSLTTVVFTLTGFRGSTNIHNTVHFNALFAIVLGKVDG
ncbi:hypothetical protein VNI00_011116 [Paramarasmius palmivorus]|uniref:Uncharacterized protein n=1 Tax=Paramarasmius palmivorus TaxID=297713 RepID=A0AAW0CHZ9_9AGAR